MARGYFIRQGDKTTCGGHVLEGDNGWLSHGAPLAREGDQVSCGEDGEVYQIAGGVANFLLNGRRGAGTLDSVSTCPCQANLIPGIAGMVYDKEEAPAARRSMPDAAQARAPEPADFRNSHRLAPSLSNSHADSADPRPPAPEPGFHIVEKSTRREALLSSLLAGMSPAAQRKFHSLNPGSDLIKAGSLIVLSDPNNHQCTREEALLMSAATSANQILESLSADEADFMMRHRDEIATFLSHGSTALGVSEAMMSNHLKRLDSLLKNLESLHQRTFHKYGHLQVPEFFAERKILFGQLNSHLNGLTTKMVGISDHQNLKRALGISSRSLVHHWTKAGTAGRIPGYTEHLSGVAKASKILAVGGWIGTGVGGAASYLKVQEVCRTGTAEACAKIKLTETGSFTGAWVGGITGAAIGARFSGAVAATICVGLGPPTGGAVTLACGLVVVGSGAMAGGLIGGYAGEATGEATGEVIYRSTR